MTGMESVLARMPKTELHLHLEGTVRPETQLLAEHGIACDVALTSNVLLTTFRDLKSHPIRQLLQAGVPVTLSTDDPAFFNTDLTHEYELAHDEVGLSLEQLWDINLNGLRFGLADVALRRRLLREFVAEGAELGLATARDACRF